MGVMAADASHAAAMLGMGVRKGLVTPDARVGNRDTNVVGLMALVAVLVRWNALFGKNECLAMTRAARCGRRLSMGLVTT